MQLQSHLHPILYKTALTSRPFAVKTFASLFLRDNYMNPQFDKFPHALSLKWPAHGDQSLRIILTYRLVACLENLQTPTEI